MDGSHIWRNWGEIYFNVLFCNCSDEGSFFFFAGELRKPRVEFTGKGENTDCGEKYSSLVTKAFLIRWIYKEITTAVCSGPRQTSRPRKRFHVANIFFTVERVLWPTFAASLLCCCLFSPCSICSVKCHNLVSFASSFTPSPQNTQPSSFRAK